MVTCTICLYGAYCAKKFKNIKCEGENSNRKLVYKLSKTGIDPFDTLSRANNP